MKRERRMEAGKLGRGPSPEPLTAGLILLTAFATVAGTIRYVDVDSANPAPPYTSWDTAARVIQDAVDVAGAGDEVVVTNGVYQTGGRAVGTSLLVNRVAVDRPLTLRSVNGPGVTVIKGYQVPGMTNGDGAVRCAYLTNGAVLSGFTLTNGATQVEGDYEREESGGGVWCESESALVTNCTFTGNSASYYGGGVYRGTLDNCTLTANFAFFGGGAAATALERCTLTRNHATYDGGGVYDSTLSNCTVANNSASRDGGGVNYSTVNNCALTGNSAREGGGAYRGVLSNCTLTGNSADYGGGAAWGELSNCIVYYNRAGLSNPNYGASALSYCCTTPLPPGGSGNLTNEPALAGAWRVSAGSPCRGTGSAAFANGVDLDGEPWLNPPAIGCDEYFSGSITGALSVAIVASWTNVAKGFAVDFQGLIAGRVSASRWEFGDGTVLSNRLYTVHDWVAPGDYTVILRAYNQDYPAGETASVTIHVAETPVHYVDLNSTHAAPPFNSWGTAATNIQDAVDAASLAGALVLVSNGVYQTGGRVVHGLLTNRVAVDKPLTVRSVNGPAVTAIKGYQVPGATNGDAAVRCVYLTDAAVLSGFTLTNGATTTAYDNDSRGGGVCCQSTAAVVTNCVLTGNSASEDGGGAWVGTLHNCTLSTNYSAARGGGTSLSMLNDCTLSGNRAGVGGGACDGVLNRCTLSGNSAPGPSGMGGGASWAILNGCTLTGNSAGWWGGGAYDATLNYCTLSNNWATETNGQGGGVFAGTLNHCTLNGNWACSEGGGAREATLNNCTLSGNRAEIGGGASTGTLSNCTLTDNSAGTGGGACGAMLNDCILTGNSASVWGGGASYGTLNNCMLTGNSAGVWGGGAYGGTLNNCVLLGNSVTAIYNAAGGGASEATLTNCTLIGNSSSGYGGGADSGTLYNCVVYYNTATASGSNYIGALVLYCCTAPLPDYNGGNITSPPLFVDYLGGNLRLQSNSPCINAGNDAYAVGPTDLDGRPRIVGGTADIGAYEYQGPGLGEYLGWLQQYGLATDGSADYLDCDGDGHNNWQEWCCRTVPTNALSALRLVSAAPAGTNVVVTWQSVAGVTYHLLRSTNLCAWPQFQLLAANLLGQPGTTTYTDVKAAVLAPLYYRVGVGTYVAPSNPPPPKLAWQFNAGARTLQLSWSGLGFHLQAQTNSLGAGFGAAWFDYPGGGSSPVTAPMEAGGRSVFYRLAWP